MTGRAGAALAAVAIASMCAAPVGAESRPRYGEKLTATLLGQPVSLDPVLARSHAEVQLVGLVFDTLYRTDSQGATLPHLATSAPVMSESGLEARIPLRKEVRFHDGSLMSAADVAASLERSRLQNGWLLGQIAGFRHQDGDVVVRLHHTTDRLAMLLAAPVASITKSGRAPSGSVVGTGPFRLVRHPSKGAHVQLAAWDQHFAGRPYAEALRLRWFRGAKSEARAYEVGDLTFSMRGQVAFTGHQPKHKTSVTAGPATTLVYVGFGNGHGRAFANRDLRQALSLALGRDSMRHIGEGERVSPTIHPIAVDLHGPRPADASLASDMAAARRALARAKPAVAALSRSGQPWQVLVDRSRPDDREIAERVVAGMFALGLTARITELDSAAMAARVARGRCDVFIGHLAAPLPDAAVQLALAFATGKSDWAEKNLRRGPLDLAKGLEQFARDLPIVPLFHRGVRIHHWAIVRRIEFDYAGRLGFADMFVHP